MKKYMMISLLLLPMLGRANKLPVEISLGVQTSYETIKFSEKEIKDAGFYNIYEGNNKIHAILSTVGLEAKYVKNVKSWDLKAGAGIDAIFETNVSKQDLKTEKVSISKSAEKVKSKLEDAEKEYSYLEDDVEELIRKDVEYGNKIEAKDFLSDKLADSIKKLKKKAKLIKKAIEYKKTGDQNKIDEEIATEKKNKEDAEKKVQELKNKISAIDLNTPEGLSEHFKLTKEKDEEFIKMLEAMTKEADLKNVKKYIDLTEEDVTKIEAEVTEKTNEYEMLETEKEEIETKKNELSDQKDELDEKMEVLEGKIKALREEFEAEYEKSIPYNNYQAALRYNELINKQINFGGSLYGIFEVEKTVKEDFKVLANIKGGLSVLNNPLYQIAKTFENEKIKINGTEYAKPTSLSKVRVKPFVQASVGLKYKDFRTEVFAGYNKGYVGLKLGYDFR